MRHVQTKGLALSDGLLLFCVFLGTRGMRGGDDPEVQVHSSVKGHTWNFTV